MFTFAIKTKSKLGESIRKRTASLSTCSRQPTIVEESVPSTAESSAAASEVDLPALCEQTTTDAAIKTAKVPKPESKPFFFCEQRMALRNFTAAVKEAVQAVQGKWAEIKEDPEDKLGLCFLVEWILPMTIMDKPGEQPSDNLGSCTASRVVAAPMAKPEVLAICQPVFPTELEDPQATDDHALPVSKTAGYWRMIKTVVRRSKSATPGLPPPPPQPSEPESSSDKMIEQSPILDEKVLCPFVRLKIECLNLCVVVVFWTLITILGKMTNWGLMTRFWVLGYCLPLCWSQISALYLVPMEVAHGPYKHRISWIDTDKLPPLVEDSWVLVYWTWRLMVDSMALLDLWPGAREGALIYYWVQHPHRIERSKVGWYRSMYYASWILRFCAFSALHFAVSIYRAGWQDGKALFRLQQAWVGAFVSIVIAIKAVAKIRIRQENVIHWQAEALEKDAERRQRRLTKERAPGSTDDKVPTPSFPNRGLLLCQSDEPQEME